jgi:hypothetical protein
MFFVVPPEVSSRSQINRLYGDSRPAQVCRVTGTPRKNFANKSQALSDRISSIMSKFEIDTNPTSLKGKVAIVTGK